jgi:hypothetical protein
MTGGCVSFMQFASTYDDLARGQYKVNGTWTPSDLGDKTLTEGYTNKVFVLSVLGGTRVRIHDKEFSGASTTSYLVY